MKQLYTFTTLIISPFCWYSSECISLHCQNTHLRRKCRMGKPAWQCQGNKALDLVTPNYLPSKPLDSAGPAEVRIWLETLALLSNLFFKDIEIPKSNFVELDIWDKTRIFENMCILCPTFPQAHTIQAVLFLENHLCTSQSEGRQL